MIAGRHPVADDEAEHLVARPLPAQKLLTQKSTPCHRALSSRTPTRHPNVPPLCRDKHTQHEPEPPRAPTPTQPFARVLLTGCREWWRKCKFGWGWSYLVGQVAGRRANLGACGGISNAQRENTSRIFQRFQKGCQRLTYQEE